jgi:hypothetical protein
MKNQYADKTSLAGLMKIYHGSNDKEPQTLWIGAERHLTFKKIKDKHYFIVDWQIPENPSPMYA